MIQFFIDFFIAAAPYLAFFSFGAVFGVWLCIMGRRE